MTLSHFCPTSLLTPGLSLSADGYYEFFISYPRTYSGLPCMKGIFSKPRYNSSIGFTFSSRSRSIQGVAEALGMDKSSITDIRIFLYNNDQVL